MRSRWRRARYVQGNFFSSAEKFIELRMYVCVLWMHQSKLRTCGANHRALRSQRSLLLLYTRDRPHRKWWREHISTHTPQNCAMCARWLVCVLWIIARVRGSGERKSEKRVCEKIIKKKNKTKLFLYITKFTYDLFSVEKSYAYAFFFNHLHFSSFTYVHSPQRNTRAIVITSTIILLRYCHHITPCMREWVQRIYVQLLYIYTIQIT